jgi:hypothetical protein
MEINYQIERAYLELSRSHLMSKVLLGENEKETNPDFKIPPNATLALVAQGYVFAHASITAFVASRLYVEWKKEGHPTEHKAFEEHLRSNFRGELKELIKELCRKWDIKPLHEADPSLWRELNSVITYARDYFMHPTPTTDLFRDVMNLTHKTRTWHTPSKVASEVISYFYSSKGRDIPEWVTQNKEFRIETIRASLNEYEA